MADSALATGQERYGMDSVVDMVRLVANKLEEVASSDIVVGQQIDLGAVKIVPLSRLSVGLGMGGGTGEGEFVGNGKSKAKPGKGGGTGALSGMGAKVRPVGVAVITESGIDIMPIADKKGIIDKILDTVPRVIEMVENAVERHEERKRPKSVGVSSTEAAEDAQG